MSQPSEAWIDALPIGDLPAGATAEVVVGEEIIALVNSGGAIYALDGVCAHQGGPLGKAAVSHDGGRCVLTCPWHGWQYDAASGEQLLSDTIRQRVFATRVVDDTIQVRFERAP
ncbi:MAG: Rieske 2Fe-2S domain-containing protein [Planctomycetota bacterium]